MHWLVPHWAQYVVDGFAVAVVMFALANLKK